MTDTTSTETTQESQTPAAARPEGLDDAYWDAATGAVKLPDLIASHTELRAFKTAADERAAGVPATPADYAVSLPDGFELPEGMTFELAADNPLFVGARDWAHKHGVPQAALSELVGLYAGQGVAFQQQQAAAHAETLRALGERAPERLAAVDAWLGKTLGEEAAAEVAAVVNVAASPALITAIEALAAATGNPIVPAGGAGGDPLPTVDDLRAIQRSPEYLAGDKEAYRKVREGFARLFPGKGGSRRTAA